MNVDRAVRSKVEPVRVYLLDRPTDYSILLNPEETDES